jgi:hypothetical protein
MSGDRQHFLPRFLLRGFNSRPESKDAAFTWVFRSALAPFESNIINVGISKDFYTIDGDPALDDLITKMEDRFGNYVNELRARDSENKLLDPDIPELITHLILRSKHLRDAFQRSAFYMIDALLRILERPGAMEELILNYAKTHPEVIWQEIEPSLKGRRITKRNKARILKLITDHLAPLLLKAQLPQLDVFVEKFKAHIRSEKFAQSIKQSHIKSLVEKNTLPQARVDYVRALNWFLVIRDPWSFILGDVAVVSKIGSSGSLKSLPDVSDQVIYIALPLSDTHLIVGVKGNGLPNHELEHINTDIASLSHEFFVSKTNTEREKAYFTVLGTYSDLIAEAALQEIVDEV